MSAVGELLKDAEAKARLEATLEHLRKRLASAASFEIDEQPTTRGCTGDVGNRFSCEEPDGGLIVTIRIPAFTHGKPVFVQTDRNKFVVK